MVIEVQMMVAELLKNEPLVAAFWGWFIAQTLKMIIDLLQYRKWEWARMVGSGGFPSSHTSLVVALCTTIGLLEGLSSTVFAVSLVFSTIVMYDAAGVRRAAGKQAELMNRIIRQYKLTRRFKEEVPLLKELIGHTPFEVLGGALLGFAVAFALHTK